MSTLPARQPTLPHPPQCCLQAQEYLGRYDDRATPLPHILPRHRANSPPSPESDDGHNPFAKAAARPWSAARDIALLLRPGHLLTPDDLAVLAEHRNVQRNRSLPPSILPKPR